MFCANGSPFYAIIFILFAWNSSLYGQKEEIKIATESDVDSLRQQIKAFIWGAEALPKVLETDPGGINADYDYYGISREHLGSIDAFNVLLKHNFVSTVYILRPKASNHLKIPVIYHSGHSQGVFQEDAWVHNNGSPFSRSFIDFLLSKGFDVICIDMPLYARNLHPETVLEHDTEHHINTHDDLFQLENPFYYFIAPIKTAIDYLEKRDGYKHFVMTGFSGGGWETTIYSAIDTRIKLSFPVSGSIPIPLRHAYSDKGDKEQNYDSFYSSFNYSTLYFLGAAGKGRRQFQILNKYDNCCFMIDGTDLWCKDVQEKLKETGLDGAFHFFFDTYSTWHKMSSVAQDSIYANIIAHLANPSLKEENRLSPMLLSAILCGEEKFHLSVSNESQSSIQWFSDGQALPGEQARAIRINNAGSYHAAVTNVISGAEIFTDTVVIKYNSVPPRPSISHRNGRLYSSWQHANQWLYNGKLIEGASGSSIKPELPGVYTAVAINDACQSESSEGYDYGIALYPTVAQDYVHIAVDLVIGAADYCIMNTNGHVFSKGRFEGRTKIVLSRGMPRGLYIIKIMSGQKLMVVRKFWKN